ncbi:HEAT repeat-containing protein 4-like [Biomphalaria glabrata]|uniref:HEAT repeat-containing protein 4-like n=1 Tax=Biomphalaria glabrata TaxID=6526 RepID=A0A9W2ZGH1_BIOGL|nr:HEAT repeat-containing protein 4-like [Biomphalaria glabrata]
MASKNIGWTNLFPCAVGVHIPKIGTESFNKDKDVLGNNQLELIPPVTIFPQDMNPVNKKYVNMLSSDIKFSQDVVEDRCLFMMPYSNKYFEDIFKPGDVISRRPISRSRNNQHFSTTTSKQNSMLQILPPLHKDVKDKATQMHKKALISAQNSKNSKLSDEPSTDNESFFITACSDQQLNKRSQNCKKVLQSSDWQDSLNTNKDQPEKHCNPDKLNSSQSLVSEKKSKQHKEDWDDYLLTGLSELTANWIVHTRLPPDRQKEKLSSLLESWYGPPTHTDLVREELSDGEEETDQMEKPKRKWIKPEALLLSAVDIASKNEASDPYSDENQAPFYRQPWGIRNKKKAEIKEEAGLINSTAQIVTQELQEPKPIRLQDLLSPRVGDKVYITDNEFQQEWLTGNKQVFNPRGDPNVIVMETDHKFLKHLQQEVPAPPESWFPSSQKNVIEKSINLPSIGHRKWTALPEIIDESAGILIDPHKVVEQKPVVSLIPEDKLNLKENNSLLTIANAWRSQWFLSSQYADSTPDDLIRDMMDIQPHVRIKAISTLAKAAEYMSQNKNRDDPNDDFNFDLPEKLFVALECLLEDTHDQVRKAAAIALFSFNKPTDKSKERLQQMLISEAPVDRWAAAQCLAHYGETDSDVVAEILKQIMTTEDQHKFEQGAHLLAKLSNHTTLVHCMVAEQLNSNSWRHKVMACKLLPTLFGTINRDISQKLSELMWHDWHDEVRKAAAQCLGKAGHGRDVHDNIRHQLTTGSERTKVEALNKIGQLGLMTGKLLPAFLECFAEPYVSIRIEVCRTCANLKIKEEQILNRLIHLASFDPIWQVKAFAMQALGKIGELNEDIKETLLWALRYEDQAGVRAEACHSLMLLDARNEEVILALQERLLVESNEMVREEMKTALTKFGVSISEDMDTVKQIKAEIVKLCTRNVIASQILINEEDESKQEHLAQMVCQTEVDKEILNAKRDNKLRLIRSRVQGSPPSSHPATPRLRVWTAEGCTSPDHFSQTAMTPSADKELEALFGLDGAESNATSKSRPVTRDSEKSMVESEDSLSVDHIQGNSRYESRASNSEESSSFKRNPSQLKKLISNQEGGTQSANNKDLSRLSHSGYFERKSILSREAQKERQLLDQEVDIVYSDLENRYMEMIAELLEADRGLDTLPAEEYKSLLQQIILLNEAEKNLELLPGKETELAPLQEELASVEKELKSKGDKLNDGEKEKSQCLDLKPDCDEVINPMLDSKEFVYKEMILTSDEGNNIQDQQSLQKVEVLLNQLHDKEDIVGETSLLNTPYSDGANDPMLDSEELVCKERILTNDEGNNIQDQQSLPNDDVLLNQLHDEKVFVEETPLINTSYSAIAEDGEVIVASDQKI